MVDALKSALRKVKDSTFTPIEVKVREATNNDPWGTQTQLLDEISAATHNKDDYPLLFGLLWKRLTDINHLMHVQKSLYVIEYLLKYGSSRFYRDAKARAVDIKKLRKYIHYDANGKDDAHHAREKAKEVYRLLTDEPFLEDEKLRAKKAKGFSGVLDKDDGLDRALGRPARPIADDDRPKKSEKKKSKKQSEKRDEEEEEEEAPRKPRSKPKKRDEEEEEEPKKPQKSKPASKPEPRDDEDDEEPRKPQKSSKEPQKTAKSPEDDGADGNPFGDSDEEEPKPKEKPLEKPQEKAKEKSQPEATKSKPQAKVAESPDVDLLTGFDAPTSTATGRGSSDFEDAFSGLSVSEKEQPKKKVEEKDDDILGDWGSTSTGSVEPPSKSYSSTSTASSKSKQTEDPFAHLGTSASEPKTSATSGKSKQNESSSDKGKKKEDAFEGLLDWS